MTVWQRLNTLGPEYFSVTFGAGGHEQEKTFRVVHALSEAGIAVVPHITGMGMDKACIRRVIQDYQARGIAALVVIRGDARPGITELSGDFRYASDLIEFIRAESGGYFDLHVAAYPEFHPQAETAFSDLANFKRKVDAGAKAAITQYFFNRESYSFFVESCEKMGISIPIVPGIMPISSFEKLKRFSKICGADVPLWLYKRLEAYGDDEASVRAYGIEILTRLCEELLAEGAPGLHFYTLNQAEPTLAILNQLGLPQASLAKGALIL